MTQSGHSNACAGTDFRGGVAKTSAVFCGSVSSSPTWLLDNPEAAHLDDEVKVVLTRVKTQYG